MEHDEGVIERVISIADHSDLLNFKNQLSRFKLSVLLALHFFHCYSFVSFIVSSSIITRLFHRFY